MLLSVALIGASMLRFRLPDVIEARTFRVIDEYGKTRLWLSKDGVSYLDRNNRLRAELGEVENASGQTGAEATYPATVVLYDAEGKVI